MANACAFPVGWTWWVARLSRTAAHSESEVYCT
jgi:hypothetical protein